MKNKAFVVSIKPSETLKISVMDDDYLRYFIVVPHGTKTITIKHLEKK